MKNSKRVFFSGMSNQTRLFLGIFVATAALVGLSWIVEAPLSIFSRAASSYTYTISTIAIRRTSNCDANIARYVIRNQWVNSDNTNQVFGSATAGLASTSSSAYFTHKLTTSYYGSVSSLRTVSAYDKSGNKIGRTLTIGLSGRIGPNKSISSTIYIPCTGYR